MNVGEIEGVELCPKDVALGAKSCMSLVLIFASARVFDDPGKREIGVFGSLREATRKIVEPAREPGIMLAQAIHAQRDELF